MMICRFTIYKAHAFLKPILIGAFIFSSAACYAQQRSVDIESDCVVTYAKTLIGTPYKYAQSNPVKGFDCSGFVSHVFGKFGMELPRASSAYLQLGRKVDVTEAQKGDIIVFTGPQNRDKTRAGHVGIICKTGDSIEFIHATSGKAKSVTITPMTQHYRERFIKIIRVIPSP